MKLVRTLLILSAIVALSYGENNSDGAPNHTINVKVPQRFANYMDKTTNPCLNFYQYSCGNWFGYHIQNRTKYTTVPEMLNYEINMEFIEYMANTEMSDKPDFVKNAHEFYASCKSVNEFKGLPVMKWLEEHENMKWILQIKTVDKSDKFDWVHTLGLMRKYGMNTIFVNETLYTKESDPSQVIVELSKPRGVYYIFNYFGEYEMENLNKTVELPEGVKYIAEFYNEIKEFEVLLGNLSEIVEEKGKQVMKVKDLPFSWLSKYLAMVLDVESLDTNMEIVINDIAYMEALNDILKNYDDEFLHRYLEVRFLQYVSDNILVDDELVCIGSLRVLMPLAMHWIYEQMHPELEQEIPKIHNMFDNILKYVNKTLSSDKSGLVRDTFLTKLDKMQLKVGNLPRQDTIKALDAFYANLSLTHTDYFGNYLQLLRISFNIEHFWTTNDVLNKFNEFFDRTENNDLSNNVLPTYDATANVMIVPSYLLRPPIYHWAYGDLFKQSSLGSVMAKYVYFALQMDDGLNEGDIVTIAGMGGVHTAYEMFFSTFAPENVIEYQSIVDEIEAPLKQMFFINAAQYYCENIGQFSRLNLIMPTLPEFVETFDCKNRHFRKIFVN